MAQHNDVALCYTQAESFIGLNVLSPRMNRRKVLDGHFIQLLRGNFFPNSSVLIRSSVFQKIGMLTEDPTLREDYEMWLRISQVYRLMGIEKSLIRYRVHATNAAGNRRRDLARHPDSEKHCQKMQIPRYIIWPNLAFQFIKYCIYRLTRR